jgi:hypothetical protein
MKTRQNSCKNVFNKQHKKYGNVVKIFDRFNIKKRAM